MNFEPYLNSGERLVSAHPRHRSHKVWLAVYTVPMLLIGLLILLAGGNTALIGVLWIVGVAWTAVPALLERKAYAITNQRMLVLTSGLLSRRMEDLPLEQAVNIEVREKFPARLFGCGDLVMNPVKTDHDIEASSMTIQHVHEPHAVRRALLEQREGLTRQRLGSAAALFAAAVPPEAPPASPPPLEIAQWYFHCSGQQLGPVTTAELRRLAREGRLVAGDLVWKQGMNSWLPAGSVHGIF